MIRKIMALTLLASMMLTLSAKKKNTSATKIDTRTIYMYGISPSFNDTIVYMTDVQVVDSAYLGGFTSYVDQLNTYFKEKGDARRTNTVYFKKTRKKAEKAYTKLRRKYNVPGIELKIIPTGEFTFKTVGKEDKQE